MSTGCRVCDSYLYVDPSPTAIYTLSLHDALPICISSCVASLMRSTLTPRSNAKRRPNSTATKSAMCTAAVASRSAVRSEEHTSELQSRLHLVCRLLLEKKKIEMVTGLCDGDREDC